MLMLPKPSICEGAVEYESDHPFARDLKAYDPCLRAHRDNRDHAIILWAFRQGQKVHEGTFKREYGVCWPELERLIISKLPMMDVWKRFPSGGGAFDDWLQEEADREKFAKLKANKAERMARFKEDRKLWEAAMANAREGRLTASEIQPYKTPLIQGGINLKKGAA